MIQKLLITKNGMLIFNQRFYDCSLLLDNDLIISSYLSAIETVSKLIIGKTIRSVNLDDLTIHYYKDISDDTILFILFTDSDENVNDIQKKFKEIGDHFFKEFSIFLKKFNGDISKFQDFNNTLIHNHIVENSCYNQ